MGNAFFSWYGSKWMNARRFGEPERNILIEPFAGSACYATFWEHPLVKLYDIDENICELWDFLINCSDDDIRKIPDYFADDDAYKNLPRKQKLLCGFWVGFARAKPANHPSPWYYKNRPIAHRNARTWGSRAKGIIIKQKPFIRDWSIDLLSYDKIPNCDAHWFVDPPYNNKAGSAYTHNCKAIDYAHLAKWCKEREGAVQVCENAGADWLPFQSIASTSTASSKPNKVSEEVYWEQGIDRIGRLI